MAFKHFELDEQTTITIYKRRASRSLKLSVAPNGQIRVSIPAWAPYAAGYKFAQSRQAWIKAQQSPNVPLLADQPIGKAHHLRFLASRTAIKPTSRLKASDIIITYPMTLKPTGSSVQTAARKASIRALRQQAEQLLPQRLALLAKQHDFNYRSVSIKQLKSRWGSCDQKQNIVLNLFLMQLPWELIDYVLLHELTHTKVLKHGPEFWQAMEQVLTDTKLRRKQIRAFQPTLQGTAK